jgi:hypothetical protein
MTGPARLADTADQLIGSYIARLAPPWEWALPAGARLAAHLAIIALVIAIGSTLFTLAATGRPTCGGRRRQPRPARPRRPRGAHLPRPLSGVSRAGPPIYRC